VTVPGFDFFRRPQTGFTPRTPAAALRAIGEGVLPAEHFVHLSTSTRPLDEEPFDMEAVDRLLARPDLNAGTSRILKSICERLIESSDGETALFGAEGISAIESRATNLIEALKSQLAASGSDGRKHRRKDRRLRRELARHYYELAVLHRRSGSLGAFYLREAHTTLRASLARGRISRADLSLLVDILVDLGLHAQAGRVLARVHAPSDPFVQLATARVAFHRGDYAKVAACCRALQADLDALGERERRIVMFWTGTEHG
jgi:hypothetical protein